MSGDLLFDDGVERPGPGKAPTAFRLWRAGVNETDIGPVNLTLRALAGLLAAQEQKGVRYSFDLNHASLNQNAPAANQVAIGDHRLDGRNGELWAVDCQFSDWARAEIERQPVPGLRYYSPAYDVDKATREPTRYVNCALTPNPATWNATALAAARGASMDPEKKEEPGGGGDGGGETPKVDLSAIVAGLHKAMTEAKDETDREMCRKALAALMPKEAASDGEKEPPGSARDGGAAAAKASAKAGVQTPEVGPALPPEIAGLPTMVNKLVQKIEEREQREAQQRASVEATERTQLAGVKGLAPDVVAAIKNPKTELATARLLAGAKTPAELAAITTGVVAGTQGSAQAIAQLPDEQASALSSAMGMRPAVAARPHIDGTGRFVVPIETPTQARERIAREKGTAK